DSGEGGQKGFQIFRFGAAQDNGRDPLRAVVVLLEVGIPEILRDLMLAGEKSRQRRPLLLREGEAEGDPDFGAVGPEAGPLEGKRVEAADAGPCEVNRIGLGIAAVESEHRQPFAIIEIVADEGAEAEGAGAVRGDFSPLAYRDELDEGGGEL